MIGKRKGVACVGVSSKYRTKSNPMSGTIITALRARGILSDLNSSLSMSRSLIKVSINKSFLALYTAPLDGRVRNRTRPFANSVAEAEQFLLCYVTALELI